MSIDRENLNVKGSIFAILNICDVSKSEKFEYNFISEDRHWNNDYTLTIYNSKEKNSVLGNPELFYSGLIMTAFFDFPEYNLGARKNFYYEIFNTTKKRIEIKGKLTLNT